MYIPGFRYFALQMTSCVILSKSLSFSEPLYLLVKERLRKKKKTHLYLTGLWFVKSWDQCLWNILKIIIISSKDVFYRQKMIDPRITLSVRSSGGSQVTEGSLCAALMAITFQDILPQLSVALATWWSVRVRLSTWAPHHVPHRQRGALKRKGYPISFPYFKGHVPSSFRLLYIAFQGLQTIVSYVVHSLYQQEVSPRKATFSLLEWKLSEWAC